MRVRRTEASGTMGSTRALQTTFDVLPRHPAILVKAGAGHAVALSVTGSVTVEPHVDGANG